MSLDEAFQERLEVSQKEEVNKGSYCETPEKTTSPFSVLVTPILLTDERENRSFFMPIADLQVSIFLNDF